MTVKRTVSAKLTMMDKEKPVVWKMGSLAVHRSVIPVKTGILKHIEAD